MKSEKSVKIIIGVLAVGVLLNAFAPVFDVSEALAGVRNLGGEGDPVPIICKKG